MKWYWYIILFSWLTNPYGLYNTKLYSDNNCVCPIYLISWTTYSLVCNPIFFSFLACDLWSTFNLYSCANWKKMSCIQFSNCRSIWLQLLICVFSFIGRRYCGINVSSCLIDEGVYTHLNVKLYIGSVTSDTSHDSP